jgi:hypothetical protein
MPKEPTKYKTDLSLVFTPEELDKLKTLPSLPKELEERMRLIANMMIDRILKDRKTPGPL